MVRKDMEEIVEKKVRTRARPVPGKRMFERAPGREHDTGETVVYVKERGSDRRIFVSQAEGIVKKRGGRRIWSRE